MLKDSSVVVDRRLLSDIDKSLHGIGEGAEHKLLDRKTGEQYMCVEKGAGHRVLNLDGEEVHDEKWKSATKKVQNVSRFQRLASGVQEAAPKHQDDDDRLVSRGLMDEFIATMPGAAGHDSKRRGSSEEEVDKISARTRKWLTGLLTVTNDPEACAGAMIETLVTGELFEPASCILEFLSVLLRDWPGFLKEERKRQCRGGAHHKAWEDMQRYLAQGERAFAPEGRGKNHSNAANEAAILRREREIFYEQSTHDEDRPEQSEVLKTLASLRVGDLMMEEDRSYAEGRREGRGGREEGTMAASAGAVVAEERRVRVADDVAAAEEAVEEALRRERAAEGERAEARAVELHPPHVAEALYPGPQALGAVDVVEPGFSVSIEPTDLAAPIGEPEQPSSSHLPIVPTQQVQNIFHFESAYSDDPFAGKSTLQVSQDTQTAFGKEERTGAGGAAAGVASAASHRRKDVRKVSRSDKMSRLKRSLSRSLSRSPSSGRKNISSPKEERRKRTASVKSRTQRSDFGKFGPSAWRP